MELYKVEHFRNKLLQEKKNVNNLLEDMKKNETINSNASMSTELSNYDNHPSDTASELFDKERGLAFKGNEMSLIKKIDESLQDIEEGRYGICRSCGKDIQEDRLELVPYAKYCIHCEDEIKYEPKTIESKPIEEKVLGYPFGYGYNDSTNKVEFDAEDAYQKVESFNKLDNINEYYYEDEEEGYVDPMESISNSEYKNQLPD